VSEGVDYSWNRPNADCLRQSGKRFAVRYVGTPTSGKNLTLTEVSNLQVAGVDLVAVYQTTAGFMADGSSGTVAAWRAILDATRKGMPSSRPIYFALDTDPARLTSSQWRHVEVFCAEAANTLGGRHRVGVYGGFGAIERLVPRFAGLGWQTYAWSGGRLSSKAALYQYRNGVVMCGGLVDLCRSLVDDFGQWSYLTAQPTEDEEDMKAYLHVSPWTGIHLVDASGATWVATDEEVHSLARVFPVEDWTAHGERFNRAYIADRQAGAEERILDEERAQTLYLSAINTRDAETAAADEPAAPES
jgi:hypothetical protein